MRNGDLGFFVQRKGARGVQRNGILHELNAVLVPAARRRLPLLLQVGAGHVGAVDLEELVLGQQGLVRGPA